MCRYGEAHYKAHYVCLRCRRTTKLELSSEHERLCSTCRLPMIGVGRDFAAPRRTDRAAWRALTVVLNAGLDFHSCGCDGPGFRPRTPAQVRERLRAASRAEIPAREALSLHDPDEALGPLVNPGH